MAKNKAAAVDHDDPITMASETLSGDLRDFLLAQMRYEHNPLSWDERSEDDQHTTINRVTDLTNLWVRRAVEHIAAKERPVILGTMTQVTVKDGIKAVVEFARGDPQRYGVVDAQGQTVLMVVSDAEGFIGMRAEVPIVPDQAEMLAIAPPEAA